MQLKLLYLVKMVSRNLLYGLILQCICLSSLLAHSGTAQIKPIDQNFLTLSKTSWSVQELFEEIESKTEYNFVGSSRLLKSKKKIEMPTQDGSVEAFLASMAAQTKMKFRQVNNSIYVGQSNTAEAPVQLPSTSEDLKSITGRVTVAEDNLPLPGVTVLIKGTNKGTVTDENGDFTIDAEPGDVLQFSFIGYLTVERLVGENSSINVQLNEDLAQLDEVVVIGYGERTKSEVSGAVTQVSDKIITRQPISSFDQGLVGQVPGLSIREGTGNPGSGPELLIRGINSLGNNAPLIVIDGFIFGNYNNENNNLLALFNPEDIESISVLKDAESKAIYGSRASGGVILITTKKGKIGRAKVSLTSSYGFQNPLGFEKPDVMNATEFAQFRKETITDNIRRQQPGLYGDPSVPVPDSLIPEQFRNPEQYGVGTDWYDAITRQGSIQTYNLSISGGTDNVKYFISGNYQDNQGVILNTDFQRYSFRSNIDFKINEVIRGGLNLNPSRTTRDNPFLEPNSGQFSAYSTLTSTYWADPTAQVRDEFGNLNFTTQGQLNQFYTRNPVYALEALERTISSNNNLVGAYLEIEPLKNLVLKSVLTYQNTFEDVNSFIPSTYVADGLTPVFPRVNGAESSAFSQKSESLLSETTLTYRFTKDKHRVDALLGWTVQDSYIQSIGINARRLLDENFRLPSFGNTDASSVDNFTGSQGYTDVRFLGALARLNYVYGDKYFANFSIRRDASSRFGPNNQWATFPAASVAWRLSEEDFLKDNPTISELRIEAALGRSGNAASVGNYAFQGNVNNANYIFGGQQALGYSLVALPNNNLTWEEQEQWDLGLKVGLFQDRLSFSLNLYRQVTEGALVNIGITNTTGFGSIIGNQGSIENRGFEFDATGIIINQPNKSWVSSLNLSAYRNEILSLVNDAPFFGAFAGNSTPVIISRVGSPIGMIQGLNIIGRYSQEDIDNPDVPKYPNAVVGGYRFEDGNGDGNSQLGLADYVDLANPHPDLIFGWTNQLTLGKFNARAVFSGQIGGHILDLRNELLFNVDGVFNVTSRMLDRFRPGDDPNAGAFPGTQGDTRTLRFPSSASVFSATHIGLRNLTLGYNLTQLVNANKRVFENLDVFMSARNVFFLSAYEFGNPEVRRASDGAGNRSINYGSYPIARTVTLGFNVTF
ncbi:SusC/RagA family TonB-linked outer membrane protein [Algoriphagus namhaensis]